MTEFQRQAITLLEQILSGGGGSGGGLSNIVEDTTPQLGGNLDTNGKNIDSVTPAELGYVHGVTSAIQTQLGTKAPIASPTFTGTPAAPTAADGTNTTQLATTAFVNSGLGTKAPTASPTFTGTPAAPTPADGTNTTQIATTAFVASGFQPKDSDLTSWAGVTRASGFDTFAATPSSSNLASLVTDETGTNKLVLSDGPTLNGPVVGAGSATAASKMKITSGTLLTTPEAGAVEYDGNAFYETVNATEGRLLTPNYAFFRLTSDAGAPIGAGIADYFGSNSAFPTVASAIYLFEAFLWFLKSTAGTVTWTLTNTGTYANVVACALETASAGFTAGNAQAYGLVAGTTQAQSLGVTGSLADAANHATWLRALVEITNAGNIRLRATESAGTITPLRGSFYRVTRLPAGNVGAFVA